MVEAEAEVVKLFIIIGTLPIVLLIPQIILAIFLWRNQKKYQSLMATVARMNCYLANLRRLKVLPTQTQVRNWTTMSQEFSMGCRVEEKVGSAIHNGKAQASVEGGTPVPGAKGDLLNV